MSFSIFVPEVFEGTIEFFISYIYRPNQHHVKVCYIFHIIHRLNQHHEKMC